MALSEELRAKLEEHSKALKVLECDGMSRVVSYLLSEANVAHRPMVGAVRICHNGVMDGMVPHVWIETTGLECGSPTGGQP